MRVYPGYLSQEQSHGFRLRQLGHIAFVHLAPTSWTRSCDRGLRQLATNWKKIRQPASIPLVRKTALTLTSP